MKRKKPINIKEKTYVVREKKHNEYILIFQTYCTFITDKKAQPGEKAPVQWAWAMNESLRMDGSRLGWVDLAFSQFSKKCQKKFLFKIVVILIAS